jgi:hypothetical protein
LVYFPAVVAKFAVEKPHTAWELHHYLNEKVQSPSFQIKILDLPSWDHPRPGHLKTLWVIYM